MFVPVFESLKHLSHTMTCRTQQRAQQAICQGISSQVFTLFAVRFWKANPEWAFVVSGCQIFVCNALPCQKELGPNSNHLKLLYIGQSCSSKGIMPGISIWETGTLQQSDTATVPSRPRHQLAEARVAAATAPCQQSALGRQANSASRRLSVWWFCDQRPKRVGFPHKWLASAGNRQNMIYQCPFCTDTASCLCNWLCQHNMLLTLTHAVDFGSCPSVLGLSQECTDSVTTFQSYTSCSGLRTLCSRM